jgi:hypothetical protein
MAYATAAPAAAPKIVPMIALPVIWNPESELVVSEVVGAADVDVVLVILGAWERGIDSVTLDVDVSSISGWLLRADTKVVLSSSPKTFTIPLLHVSTRLPPETVVYASSSSSWW